MAMNRVATLLIGLGGIGCRIVDNVNKMLSEEDKQFVGCIGMDTNLEDLKKLSIKYVQTSDEHIVKEFLERHPEYRTWFPVNRFTVGRGMLSGAGQIRAISRLAGLAAQEGGRFSAIDQEIKRIRKHNAEVNNTEFNLLICGSITGGTGAGLFLQIPFYVKKVLKGENGMTNVRTRGMFISADITRTVQPSKINEDAVMVNAYACLKELNAFYMTQVTDDSENHLKLEYYEPADSRQKSKDLKVKAAADRLEDEDYDEDNFDPDMEDEDVKDMSADYPLPYDSFYLIEGTDSKGGTGLATLTAIESHVARMIFTMLFTPVKSELAGVSDNYVLHDMHASGMNRYSGAGMCTLRYPFEQMQEYATLCWLRELVKNEWLYLDWKFEREVKDARNRIHSDPSAKIPDVKDKYVQLFEEETSGKKGTRLGALRAEAYTPNPGNQKGDTVKVAFLIKKLEAMANEKFTKGPVDTQVDECKLNMKMTENLDGAEAEFIRVYDELEKLETLIQNTIKENSSSIANDVFPVGQDSLDLSRDKEVSIYQLLANVHPVAARYLCYVMINQLNEKIRKLEPQVNSADLTAYEEEDFDTKTDGNQKANEAVEILRSNKIPVIRSGKKPLKNITSRFNTMVGTQISTLLDYGKNSVKLSNYKLLRDRFEVLAEYYKLFFDGIQTRIDLNEDRISRLEKSYIDPPFGEISVCASPEAFQTVYEEFSSKLQYTLPEETKKAIFDGVFKVASSALEDKDTRMSDKQKQKRDARISQQMGDLFRTGVVDTLNSIVMTKSQGVIDMSLKEAIAKEVEITSGLRQSDDQEEFEAARIARERELIQAALIQAEPMLAVNSSEPLTENIYLTVNPDVAEEDQGQPSKAKTQEHLVPEACAATDNKPVSVLIDPEFSRYEIMVMKARHNYKIEELVKYKDGGIFHEAYMERISNLGHEPTTEGLDAYVTVVNPHLNRYWHEEGFIPAIGVKANLDSRKAVRKAFVYAMGMDSFIRMVNEDNGKTYWYYDAGRKTYLVRKAGVAIKNGYVDLLDAMYFNRRFKTAVLKEAERMKASIKGFADSDQMEQSINDSWFLDDLAQSEMRDEEGDENIIDIFLGMYSKMNSDKWDELFDGLEDCLHDYLSYMFDGNKVLIDRTYPKILDNLIAYSQLRDVNLEAASRAEGTQVAAVVKRAAKRLLYIRAKKYL